MAGLQEMNSFLTKFVNLWRAGKVATLQLSTSAGEAQVQLQVGLGHAPPPQDQPTRLRRAAGPARLRRRQRREEAHKAAEEAVSNEQDDVVATEAAVEAAVCDTTEDEEDTNARAGAEQALNKTTTCEDATFRPIAETAIAKVNDDLPSTAAPHDVNDVFCPDRDYLTMGDFERLLAEHSVEFSRNLKNMF